MDILCKICTNLFRKFFSIGVRISGIYVALIVAGVVIIGIFGFGLTNIEQISKPEIITRENPNIELHNTMDDLTEQETIAINTVQNYNGKDNQGSTIAYLIGQIISSKYSDEIIYDSDTKLGWSAYSDPDDQNLYGVSFDFVSTTDEFSFLWYVDLKNDVIYSPGGGSDEILDIVDSNS